MSERGIPFSVLLGPEEGPRITTINNQEHREGPLTVSCSAVVAAHITSFYRTLATTAVLLFMIAFGVLTIVFGHLKSDSCPSSTSLPRGIIAFGILDIVVCGILILIVSFILRFNLYSD